MRHQRASIWRSARALAAAGMLAGLIGAAHAAVNAPAKSDRVLYAFTGSDGQSPYAGLVEDKSGNLFGTTLAGGVNKLGTVFRLAPDGTETVLHSFGGAGDGEYPYAGLIEDAAGNLYGTTYEGGAHGFGTVFRIAPDNTETLLYSFADGTDGGLPYAGVILDKKENLYGTARQGGDVGCASGGCGTVFRLAPDGKETVLYTFTGLDGALPEGSLIEDKAGNFYGTTIAGGADGNGAVFKLAPHGKESVLHSFTGGSDGANPVAGVIQDGKGNLFGTTFQGGTTSYGVVFEIAPDGSETVLHTFSGGMDGINTFAGLIKDGAGNLYGTTIAGGSGAYGTVFRLTPGGKESVLYSFTSGSDGALPAAGVIMDRSGNLYGTTRDGGADNDGVIFKLKK